MQDLPFNPQFPAIMHLDINSCFATIEQQANPHLRGKAIAVAAYATPNGCILAPSIEAKKYGVKVGMRVKEGKLLCPDLIVLLPDPWKYRNVHLALRKLLLDYTNNVSPRSIDEFVLNLEGYPVLSPSTSEEPIRSPRRCCSVTPPRWIGNRMFEVGNEIKQRIKKAIGEWLAVSIGIAPNRYLAKVAAGLHKPDGLDEINKDNFLDRYRQLKLTDLPWIKAGNAVRLNAVGIYSVLDFYRAPYWQLKAAFQSILAYYWYLRLRGWEVDDVTFSRRSYGNSYALPKPLSKSEELSPILTKLVEKMSARLRRAGFMARGIHLAIFYRDFTFWHKAITFKKEFFSSRDIQKEAFKILHSSFLGKPVRELAVSVFNLIKDNYSQLDLFEDVEKKKKLTASIDKINERWGNFVIYPARMIDTKNIVSDRIAFGGIKELEEFIITRQ